MGSRRHFTAGVEGRLWSCEPDRDSTEMRGGLNAVRFVEFVGLELFGKLTQDSGQGRSSFVRSAPWFAQRVPEISRSYAHCRPRTDPSP